MTRKQLNIYDTFAILSDELLIERIKSDLQNDPYCAHQRGYNNVTILHHAALSRRLRVLKFLLQLNLDPNAKDLFNQTPLHFACLSGNVQMCHSLLLHEAELSSVDNAGRNAILHASQSGSVAVIHYLTSVHGCSVRVSDKRGLTPLHIACSILHMELIGYLLQRSDVFAQAADGSTCLHMVTEKPSLVVAWRLLCIGGSSLVQLKNNDGQTALDLARANADWKHARLLAYYSANKMSLHGPALVWLWHWMCPSFLYLVAVAYQFAFPGQGFLAMLIAILFIVIMMMQQSHRISHPCQWPNPMFAGLFAAGISHSILCFYYNYTLVLVQRQTLLFVICVVLTLLALNDYFKLLTKDPGIVSSSLCDSAGERNILDVGAGLVADDQFCMPCEIIQPPRTKHCRLCGKCFYSFDHHCQFLNCCIAGGNHSLFVRFLGLVLAGMLLMSGISCYCLAIVHKYSMAQCILEQAWPSSLCVMNFGCALWLSGLLFQQVKNITVGQTFFFKSTSTQRPTIREKFLRVLNFLCK